MQTPVDKSLTTAIFVSLTIIASGSAQSKPTVITFDPVGAQDTQPQSINDSGWVTGYFRGRDGHVNGFVRTADGRIKTINVPGSTLTQATSINGPGVITGNYQDASSLAHGFIRTPDGSITMIDVGSVLTQPMAINDSGMIVGYYIAKQAWTQRDGYVLRPRGFLRYPDGTTQKFDPPGSVGTYPTSINAGAVVAGYYFADHGVHGFSRSPDGVITVFDAPKADDQTFAMSINDTGDITGYYQKGVNAVGGFLRQTDGRIVEFGAAERTFALGIDKNGLVSGYSYNEQYDAAFTRDTHGKIRQFQIKGMSTTASASNANRTIAGNYYDGSRLRGYIRIP